MAGLHAAHAGYGERAYRVVVPAGLEHAKVAVLHAAMAWHDLDSPGVLNGHSVDSHSPWADHLDAWELARPDIWAVHKADAAKDVPDVASHEVGRIADHGASAAQPFVPGTAEMGLQDSFGRRPGGEVPHHLAGWRLSCDAPGW